MQEYGSNSADSATALNNMGCSLYCLRRKGEARILFDSAWQVFSSILGHRHPRAVVTFNNCEKARKSQALLTNAELNALVENRPDASKLLYGGTFIIQALDPAKPAKEKKGGKKKGGKKKK